MSVVGANTGITPLSLGNPVRSLLLRNNPQNVDDDLIRDIFSVTLGGWQGERAEAASGFTSFVYQADKERYETGYHITVNYSSNDDQADCVENTILERHYPIETEMFRNKILTKIEVLLPVTLVEVKTANGTLEVRKLPRNIRDAKAYLPIPKTMAILPCVPISDLRKCPVSTTYPNIDIVYTYGDPDEVWYVFKRYRIPLERQHGPMGTLLSEVEHLIRIKSPYVINPSFLVTDDESNSLFRGYLMPFMPAGALEHVFEELRAEGPIVREPMLSHPKFVKPFVPPDYGKSDEQKTTLKPTAPKIPWSIKYTWATEATTALVTLHDSGIYSGDVKLGNILLGRDGHIRFIDVAPQDGYTDRYLAPEFATAGIPPFALTEPRDIYAFGVVLWQIAEEEMMRGSDDDDSFHTEDTIESFFKPLGDLTWRSGVEGSTPEWYRDLVARCVDSSPTNRPSAKDILAVLQRYPVD